MTIRPTLPGVSAVDPRQLKPAQQGAQPVAPKDDDAKMRVRAGAGFMLPTLAPRNTLRIHHRPAKSGPKPLALSVQPASSAPKDIEVGGGFVIRPLPSIGERAAEVRRATGHSCMSAGENLASGASRFSADGEPWRGHPARLHATKFGGKRDAPRVNARTEVFSGDMVQVLGPGFTQVRVIYDSFDKAVRHGQESYITVSSRNKGDQRSLARLGREDTSISTVLDTTGRETAELSAKPKYYRIPFSSITVHPALVGAKEL